MMIPSIEAYKISSMEALNSHKLAQPTLVLFRNDEEMTALGSELAHLKGPDLHISLIPKDDFFGFIQAQYENGIRHFVSCGGDGSLNFLINALMSLEINHDCSVGIVPLGTANDFATALGISVGDINSSLSQALFSPICKVDVASVGHKYFINVLSGGSLAKVTRDVPRDLKDRLGPLAYMIYGLKELTQVEALPCMVRVDGVSKEYELTGFAIGNGRQAGGGFSIGTDCKINDNQLEVLLIPELSTTQMAELIFEAKKSEPQFDFDFLESFHAKNIAINSQDELPLNLDGEAWEAKSFEVQVIHQCLGLACPGGELEMA